MMNKLAVLLIAASGILWGTISIYTKQLTAAGLSPIEISFLRALTAAVLLLLYLLLRGETGQLKIEIRHIGYFIGTGVLSMAFFNFCYFTAIEVTSVSVAAVLLYTAPAFVLIFSRIVFKERLTAKKLVALMMTVLGCSLVCGLLPAADLYISRSGFLFGMGAAVGYALYSIFGKVALKRYSSLTIIVYTFIFAALAQFTVSGIWNNFSSLGSLSVWFYIIALGIFPTVLAYILYTNGLKMIDPGQAAIIATIEPVVAVLLGVAAFGDVLSLWQTGGIVLILLAIIMLNIGDGY